MLRKVILSTLLAIGLNTTGVMAKGNTQLANLASKQETVSHIIVKAYKKQDSGSVSTALATLESGHKKLQSQTRDPEVKNMLTYLNLCIKNLKEAAKRPYNSQNAQKVAELSALISEGNHYIIASL